MNFTALKMEEIVFFVAAGCSLFAVSKLPAAAMRTPVSGGHGTPFLWNIKDDILSDIPFFFFVVLTAFQRRMS